MRSASIWSCACVDDKQPRAAGAVNPLPQPALCCKPTGFSMATQPEHTQEHHSDAALSADNMCTGSAAMLLRSTHSCNSMQRSHVHNRILWLPFGRHEVTGLGNVKSQFANSSGSLQLCHTGCCCTTAAAKLQPHHNTLYCARILPESKGCTSPTCQRACGKL